MAGCGDDGANPNPAGTSSSSGSGGSGAGGPEDPIQPAAAGIRRLLKPQYLGSLRVLFGEVAVQAADPPADLPLKGFDAIGAAEITLASSSVERYEHSAREVAAAVVADPATRATAFPCEPTTPSDATCLSIAAGTIGRVAWRRTLTGTEIARLVGTAQVAGNEYGTVDAALESLVSALIQSPNFLYIVELGSETIDEATGGRLLTPGELATRISFFLTNATPTAALLDGADAGHLETDEGIAAVAEQMLGLSEARWALDAFYAEVFRLREIDVMDKSAEVYPLYTPELQDSMREETLQLIRDIVWNQDTDARGMFNADYTFIDADLATLYGVSAPSGTGFAKTTLPAAQQRRGLLGHAGLLALLSHSDSSSATRRGNFVQSRLLCSPLPPPPPDVVPNLPPDDDGQPKTAKQKLQIHMDQESCSSCHLMMDPIGFALEHYDGIGAYREKDKGLTIDPSGTIPNLGDFAGPAELADLIRNDDRSARCLVRNLYRHSMGHMETKGEFPALARLDEAFEEDGFRIQQLLVSIVQSPAFRQVTEPK
jgi:hypothetical protein